MFKIYANSLLDIIKSNFAKEMKKYSKQANLKNKIFRRSRSEASDGPEHYKIDIKEPELEDE